MIISSWKMKIIFNLHCNFCESKQIAYSLYNQIFPNGILFPLGSTEIGGWIDYQKSWNRWNYSSQFNHLIFVLTNGSKNSTRKKAWLYYLILLVL